MTTFLTKAFWNLMLLDKLQSSSSTHERSLNNVARKIARISVFDKRV